MAHSCLGAPGRFEADENLRLLKALSSALQTSYSITSPGLSTTDSTSSSAAIRYSTDSQSSASKFSSSAHTLPVCTPDHPAAAATATAAREPVNIASFSNTLDSASRSAEAITQNIEDLEADITALAEHIGIDTANLGDLFDNEDRLGDFVDGYGFMISKASRMDKIKLFELAGGSHIKNRYDESKTPQPFYDSHGSAQHHRQNLMHQVPAHAHQLPSVTTAYTSPAISHSTGTNVQAPLPSSMSPRAHHEPHTQQQQKQQNTVVADNNDLHNTNFPPSFFEGGFPPNLLQPFYPVISFPSVAQGEQHQFVAVPVPVPVPYPIQHYNFPNPVPGQQPAGPSAVGGIMDGSHAPMNYLYATAAQATSTSEEASQGLPESTSDPLASKAPRQ
ncbi:hypothetical protein BX666DRAFT_1585876 [Dichotomocladium elegans]|nr:hypothetical protein BX666DRAFT_1585876 [Dichotomocladium elegans]